MNPQERLVAFIVAVVGSCALVYIVTSAEPSMSPPAPLPVTTTVEREVRAAQVPGSTSSVPPVVVDSGSRDRAQVEPAGLQNRAAKVRILPVPPIEDLIRLRFAASGHVEVVEQAVRVARCESHLDPAARSGAHWGLFQISDLYHADRVKRLGYVWSDLLRAEPNIDVAYDLWAEQGWTPWSCRP